MRKGRCSAHTLPTRWGQGNRGNRRSSTIRALVLREEPLCRYCRRYSSTEVDHIIPLVMGGTSDRHNLAGVCGGCHQTKTQREAATIASLRRV